MEGTKTDLLARGVPFPTISEPSQIPALFCARRLATDDRSSEVLS